MIPLEKSLVEKLKTRPFALLGINSDEDREFSKKLDKDETALFKKIGRPDASALKALNEDEKKLARKVADLDRAACNKVLAKAGITWRQAVDGSTEGPWARTWNISGWPTIYVLDAQGRIRYRDPPDDEIEKAIVGLITELENAKK